MFRARRVKNPLLDMLLTVGLCVVLAVTVQAAVVKPYVIPSESMAPTLNVGDRLVVDRISGRFGEPKLGQIMVFFSPVAAQTDTCRAADQGGGTTKACSVPDTQVSDIAYVKRVVGMPGDRIAVREGRVIRNGVPDDSVHTVPCSEDLCDMPEEIVIPAGHYFMMGDNRGNSADSRVWGPVARSWMVGPARLTYWPANQAHLLR